MSGDGKWLRVADAGCGMTRGDLINRLAAPGASRCDRGDEVAWRAALKSGDAAAFSAAFGGGVFAAVAVADALHVVTKADDDAPYSWTLDATAPQEFSIHLGAKQLGPFFGGALDAGSLEDSHGPEDASDGAERVAFPYDGGTVVSLRLRDFVKGASDFRAVVEASQLRTQYAVELLAPGDELQVARVVLAFGEDEGGFTKDADTSEVATGGAAAIQKSEPESAEAAAASAEAAGREMLERCRYIPLRLSHGERKVLRLVEAALRVSGYVDRVDSAALEGKAAKRQQLQLRGITKILRGLVVAADPGRCTAHSQSFADDAPLLRACFEVARRYKILNPELMRSEYGTLVNLLQDASALADEFGVDCVRPVETVHRLLSTHNGLALLDDAQILDATSEVLPDSTKSRAQMDQLLRRKARAVRGIVGRHARNDFSAAQIELCLVSICDNESYLNSNRAPIDATLALLRKHFDPRRFPEGPPPQKLLAIQDGGSGARLSHPHARQFKFAEQSLLLWREIVGDMFRHWHGAEADLLSGDAPYALRDTGQGLQRVQPCPRSYAAMRQTLARASRSSSSGEAWVGSSMIHMGDHNVPNALVFLDKYAQVARILRPLVSVLARARQLCGDDPELKRLVDDAFGSPEDFEVSVLADFFRHAFDGSGADNFYDAGSCVDGRLTSAWNWCSQVSRKPYLVVFKLCGFAGFDGQFH